MKRLLFTAAMLVVAFPLTFAQTTQGTSSKPAGPQALNAEEELTSLERAWLTAWTSGDVKAMDGLLADDHVDVTVEGKVNTKADNLSTARENAKDSKSQMHIRLDEMRVKFYGDTAVVTSRANMQSAAGADAPIARLLSVWVRMKGRWQSVAHQATAIPSPTKAQ